MNDMQANRLTARQADNQTITPHEPDPDPEAPRPQQQCERKKEQRQSSNPTVFPGSHLVFTTEYCKQTATYHKAG